MSSNKSIIHKNRDNFCIKADFEITERPTYIRWVKIFTWKANGDGISTKKNSLIEDCFLRTQDDAVYVTGRGMRR